MQRRRRSTRPRQIQSPLGPRICVSLAGCAKTVRKIRQGRLRLDTDLRARCRTQVLDRFIVPSHMYGCECQFDRRMGIDDAYLGMGKARLEVPVHSSAQASPWPNSLGKCPFKTLSPHTKEKPIIFARFWSILQYLTITFASFILPFYWGTLTPGLPHTSEIIDYTSCILHCCFLTYIHLLLFSLFSWFTSFPTSATKVS